MEVNEPPALELEMAEEEEKVLNADEASPQVPAIPVPSSAAGSLPTKWVAMATHQQIGAALGAAPTPPVCYVDTPATADAAS